MLVSEPRWVKESTDVEELAAAILDPGRTRALIGVSARQHLREPMIDPATLQERVRALADVWVITRAQHAWELTAALPPRLDVYGGAVRVWWPSSEVSLADVDGHRVFTVFDPVEARGLVSTIAGYLDRQLSPPPEVGADVLAVVSRVVEQGAELTLASGWDAFVGKGHIAHGTILHANEALRTGQRVRARITGERSGHHARFVATLLPFAPDPWQRIAEVYRVGMVVDGIVEQLKHFGAFVELLPGASGLLPVSKIAEGYVQHPSDHLAVHDRVAVLIERLDPAARRAELVMRGVGPDTPVEPPLSIYPDGPPWLEPEPDERPEMPASPPNAAPIPAPPATPAAAPTAPAASPPEAALPPAASALPVGEARELADAIAVATDAAERLRCAAPAVERQLSELRSQARRVAADLRDEVAALEIRVLRVAEQDGAAAVEASRDEVRALERKVAELTERLRGAEADRAELVGDNDELKSRVNARERQADEAKERERAAEAEAETLRAQLEIVDGSDAARRFLREVRFAWTTRYAGAERETYPFTEPVLGASFLRSLASLRGIARTKVLEVCAHVAAGRAADLPGLELHALRESEGGDTPQRVRADGAAAWRVSLQSTTPAARRLHFWLRTDGRVELSKVGVHDDITIV